MKKQQPIVSIGMPVYNGERYIKDALNSLLSQTLEDFELFISDNASTDSTGKICKEYSNRDSRIKYFCQPENIGHIANFEFVLRQAKSEYFMWAACDDVWDKTYLSSAVNLLEENIDFIFPTFLVKSIGLGFYKSFDKELFNFLESENRKSRVLKLLALHHDSHKCNIVYSLFRAKFLREALKKQDIGNDGTLGAIVAGMGKGRLLDRALFQKRYPWLWPGLLSPIYRLLRKPSHNFEESKKNALRTLENFFPEYASETKLIFNAYKPYSYMKSYLICDVDNIKDMKV
jgi:glycosyltransferase involved in cell wall biosynthesis